MFNKGSVMLKRPLKMDSMYSMCFYVPLRALYASVRGNTEGFLVFPPIVENNPSGSVKECIC